MVESKQLSHENWHGVHSITMLSICFTKLGSGLCYYDLCQTAKQVKLVLLCCPCVVFDTLQDFFATKYSKVKQLSCEN